MERITLHCVLKEDEMAKTHQLDVHKSVHRDTTMRITNKMHYIG